MTVTVYWQLDVAAEPARLEAGARSGVRSIARDVRTSALVRYDYYAQIARAAAQTAFDGLFLPHREESDDSQIVAAAIAREVPRLLLIPQFPASVGSAVYAAKQAVSFQRATHERLGWAIAPDDDAGTRARGADHVSEEGLVARTEEFLTVARGVHADRPFSFKGEHFEVLNGGFGEPLNRVRFPKIFLEGESEEALELSARRGDVHLFRNAPLRSLQGLIETLDNLAARHERKVEFGIVQTILAREDAEEAQDDARALGAPLHMLVGDYDTVAAELAQRAALGVTHFVLSAAPSLEESYRVGQHVLPRLRALLQPVRAAA